MVVLGEAGDPGQAAPREDAGRGGSTRGMYKTSEAAASVAPNPGGSPANTLGRR